MIISAVDALSGKGVLQIGYDGLVAGPNVGDILVLPDRQQMRVLQRAYIVVEAKPTGNVVDLMAPKQADFELQLAVCPVGQETQYSEELAK